MKVKGVISLPLIPDPEVSYLLWVLLSKRGVHLGAAGEPRRFCPANPHSSAALEHSSLPRPKTVVCRSCSPCKSHGVKRFSSERGNSQSSLKQSFSVVWGFHLHKRVFCCSFVSSLGFIMKLICLECSQTLCPGSHRSGQGPRGS